MKPCPLCRGRYHGKAKDGNVTEVIFKLIKKFKMPPYQINNGDCKEFAEQVIKRVRYATLYETDNDLRHFFVKVKGKFYDAETPHDVDKWEQLPIYNQI